MLLSQVLESHTLGRCLWHKSCWRVGKYCWRPGTRHHALLERTITGCRWSQVSLNFPELCGMLALHISPPMEHSLLALQHNMNPHLGSTAGVEHTCDTGLATKRLKQNEASPIYMVDDGPPGKYIAFQGKLCTTNSVSREDVQSGFDVADTVQLSSRCHLWCSIGHATPSPTQPMLMCM